MHLHLTKEEGELGAVACGKHAFIAFSLTPRTGLTSKAKECISVLFTKAFRFFPLYSIARKLMVARRVKKGTNFDVIGSYRAVHGNLLPSHKAVQNMEAENQKGINVS